MHNHILNTIKKKLPKDVDSLVFFLPFLGGNAQNRPSRPLADILGPKSVNIVDQQTIFMGVVNMDV